ncbi:MAG: hypothetical protein WC785_09560 [Tatlockia sp.]
MNLVKKGLACAALLFAGVATASTGHLIKLYADAEPGAVQYIRYICLTTNNGFTKSCGVGATRSYTSGPKTVKIVSFDLSTAFGFDESCRGLRSGVQTPEGKGTFEVFTTLSHEIVNNVEVVAVTKCSTAWTPE